MNALVGWTQWSAGRTRQDQTSAVPVAMLQFCHWPHPQQDPGPVSLCPVSLWPHRLRAEEGAERGPALAVGRG